MLVSANGYTQIKVNTMITEVKRPIIDNKAEHLNIKLYQKNFTIHYPSSSDPSEKVYIQGRNARLYYNCKGRLFLWIYI